MGTLFIFILPFIVDPPAGGPSESGAMVTLLFVFGYLFGILPSGLAAYAYSRAAPRLTTLWGRLLGCVCIGALCGAFGILLPVSIFARGFVFEPAFMLMAAMAGSVALPLTALPFARPAS